jgi:hypothetical protein
MLNQWHCACGNIYKPCVVQLSEGKTALKAHLLITLIHNMKFSAEYLYLDVGAAGASVNPSSATIPSTAVWPATRQTFIVLTTACISVISGIAGSGLGFSLLISSIMLIASDRAWLTSVTKAFVLLQDRKLRKLVRVRGYGTTHGSIN